MPYGPIDRAEAETIVFKTVAGQELEASMFRPTKKVEKSPAFLYIHGGGWAGGNRWEPLVQYELIGALRDMGVTLITVEYRRTRDGIHFPTPVHDCVDYVRFFWKNAEVYGLDRAHFFLGGASAGGHLSLMAAFAQAYFGEVEELKNVRYRIAGIVDLCGPVDLRAKNVVRGQEESDGCLVNLVGSDPATRDELLRQASPATYFPRLPDDELMPIIAVQGTEDELVHYTQPTILQKYWNEKNVPFELLYVKNGSHAFHAVEGFPPPEPDYSGIQQRELEFIQTYILK